MSACKSAVLLVCLALLAGASTAFAAGASCAAESQCVATDCGSFYANPASDLPYAVDYTTTGDSVTTTFIFKVCSTGCKDSEATCQPLKSFRLRLADDVLAAPTDFIKMANPEGAISDSCANAGLGWFINGLELMSLSSQSPADGEECEVFSVTVYNPPDSSAPLTLGELCQQDVTIVEQDGTVVFDQANSGTSCMFTMELSDGTSGVGAVVEEAPLPPNPSPEPSPSPSPKPSPSPSPEPSPSPSPKPSPSPSPSPKPSPSSSPSPKPSPSPSPSPSPRPSPSPKPHPPTPSPHPTPYYGGGAYSRRLQQAPIFRRGLLHSGHYYYGASSHRRLSGATDAAAAAEPLLFATRRLMEASAVPLPLRLVARDAASRSSLLGAALGVEGSLGASGRRLSSYPYYGSGHRRSMLSVGLDSVPGTSTRQLTSYPYYGSSHRRSMLSVGLDATMGASSRQLASYPYYGSSHRRSMLSVGLEQAHGSSGRQLTSYPYYGSSHRRSMLSVGLEQAHGSSGRQLTSYPYYGSSHRRSMLSVGLEHALGASGRQLSSYPYYGSHRRSMLSVGLEGRAARRLTYYYGGH